MNFFLKKEIIFILFFCSIFVSFFYGENSSGGAYKDFVVQKEFIMAFDGQYLDGFKWFLSMGQMHLPFFYFFKSILDNFLNPLVISLINILVSSFIPLIFYKILKKKYQVTNRDYLFLLSLIIFLSPYFRSSAVWGTNDNLATFFFTISIYFFFNFQIKKQKKLLLSILCFFFLILASYIRQNYIFFSIYFFYFFLRNLSFLNFIYLNIFNFLISLPLLIYVYYFFLESNSEVSIVSGNLNFDIFFSILVFSSIYFFYFIPIIYSFFLKNSVSSFIKEKKKILFFLVIFFSILIAFYSIPSINFGGGVFYKLSNLIHINLFYLFSFLGLFFLLSFNKINFENISIFFIVILSFPLIYVYQKYFDPLIYIVFLFLINSKTIDLLISKKDISIISIYIFLGSFLAFSFLYNL